MEKNTSHLAQNHVFVLEMMILNIFFFVGGCVINACSNPPVTPPTTPVVAADTTKPRITASLFQDVSASLPRSTEGRTMDVVAADLDGDGDKDLVLAMEFAPNVILINDKHGNFTDESLSRLPQINRDSEDIAVADFDKDGDLDIIFVSEDDVVLNRRPTHEYYLNDGRGVFTTAPYRLPDSETNAIAVADLNNDTYLDIVLGNTGQDFILINDKRGGFIDETEERMPILSDITQDVKLADIDKDGDLDMFLGNENGNKILVNNGQGIFTDQTQRRFISQLVNLQQLETRKCTFEDVDNDGDLDIFLSNVAFMPSKNPQARLFINDGTGIFADATSTRLPLNNAQTLDGMFIDIDNDGDRDLVTVGFGTSIPFGIYQNDGRGVFQTFASPILGRDIFGRGISMEIADLNNDRRPDIFMGFHGEPDMLFLSR